MQVSWQIGDGGSVYFIVIQFSLIIAQINEISDLSSGEYLDNVSATTISFPGQYLIVKS